MTYIVTARKWRPMKFDDVVGQAHVTTTLRNAISSNRLHHAYVFSGPRGVGKTTTARILAKAINCLHPKDFDPDNTCELCSEITEGRSVHVFEIDGASNRGIEEIRSLREAVRYAPAKGKYKVYIIDEVHMLTKEAFNALLKTLEEPPPFVVFVLATTEIHKVPLTILSRCQRFDFRRVTVEEVCSRLSFIAGKEKIKIDEEALFVLAHKADGSMRDAQSLFDQVISFCGTTIDAQQIMEALNIVDSEFYFRVTNLISSKDSQGMLTLVETIMSKGYDFKEFLGGFIEHLRNMLIARSTGSAKFIEASETFKSRYEKESRSFSEVDLLRLIKLAVETESAIKWSPQPRYRLEIALLQMLKMDSSIEIDKLLQQLEEIKKSLAGGSTVIHGGTSGTSDMFSGAPTPAQNIRKAPPVKAQPVSVMPPLRPVSEPSTVYASKAKVQVNPVQSQAEQQIIPISMDEALSKWHSLVSEIKLNRQPLVAAMMSDSRLIGIKDNRLQIGCPDDFHLETFKENREFLFKLAEKVYGAKVRLEAIVAKEDARIEHEMEQTELSGGTGNMSMPQAGNDLLTNPNVQLLIQEFDCEIIQ